MDEIQDSVDDTIANTDDSPFTEDEQLSLTMLPSLIGSAVAFSAKSGAIGTVKEMMANARAIATGRTDYPDNSLINGILPNLDNREEALARVKTMQEQQLERLKGAGVQSSDDMRTHTMGQITEIGAMLDAKADPGETAEFKQWVLGVGEAVAGAAKEGGFFGIGGEEVSDGEVEALAAIRAALGL